MTSANIPLSPMRLQRALITGGARRIGGALSQELAAAGWSVVIHARPSSAQEAHDLVAQLCAQGADAHVVLADLLDEAETAQLIPRITQTIGPLSLLINNAAIFLPDSAHTFDMNSFSTHMSINVRAPLQLSAAFFEQRPPSQIGNIIHLLDQRIWRLSPDYFSYTLSKSTLWTATRTMAQAYAPFVRVNAIGPGPTFPNAIEGEAGFYEEVAHLPLQTHVSAHQIAQTVLYLVNASHVTGQMIAVDSGQHLYWK